MSIPNLSQKNIKMTFNPPSHLWKCHIFLLKNILHRYHRKQNSCKTNYTILYYAILWYRPTYYTMITLFHQHRKFYNQNNKTFHLISHMALPQAAALISMTEPSRSVPGSYDRYEQLLTAGNFEIISNLDVPIL